MLKKSQALRALDSTSKIGLSPKKEASSHRSHTMPSLSDRQINHAVRVANTPGWAKAFQGGNDNKEPTVRTDSLLEQRGFEPPVLFVVPGAYEGLEFSAG
jgi:hypothetical protein